MTKLFRLRYGVLVGLFFVLASFSSDKGKYYEIARNLEIFTNLYKEVNTYYVDDLDPSELMKKGIDAMLGSLDPYTSYISETDIEGYRFYTEGKYHGIGASVKQVDNRLVVISVVENGPADKALLVPGDEIISVAGKTTAGKTPEDLDKVFKGVPGTSINLGVKAPTGKEKSIKIVREDVMVDNVPFYGMVNEDVGYISLTVFSRNAAANVKKAYKELKSAHPDLKGLVLDLRNNGGGLLAEAVDIVNIFVPQDNLVVTTKGKVVEWDRTFMTRGNATDLEIPLVVLTNKNSASASEIVSGSIQDLDRGVIIGQRTYGKGLVQNTKDLGYNSKVKMTTAKYYIPSKRCIQSVEYDEAGEPVEIPDTERAVFHTKNGRPVLDGGGIAPDILLEETDDTPLMKALFSQYMIFDYVTQLVQKGEKMDSIELYSFDKMNDFMDFLKKKQFTYQTDTESAIAKLEAAMQEDGFNGHLTDNLQSIETEINRQKEAYILNSQDIIRHEIEEEIAARFYHDEGRIRMALRNDQEIKEAVRVLHDTKHYSGILSGTDR